MCAASVCRVTCLRAQRRWMMHCAAAAAVGQEPFSPLGLQNALQTFELWSSPWGRGGELGACYLKFVHVVHAWYTFVAGGGLVSGDRIYSATS